MTGGPDLIDPSFGSADCSLAFGHSGIERAYYVVTSGVAVADVGHALRELHALPVGPDGHVGIPEQITSERALVEELGQLLRQSQGLRLSGSRRVERDQPDQSGRDVRGREVAGPVERVEARDRQRRGVPNVVQPGGSVQQLGVIAEVRAQATSAGSHVLNVHPSARKLRAEKISGRLLGPLHQLHPSSLRRSLSVPTVQHQVRQSDSRSSGVAAGQRRSPAIVFKLSLLVQGGACRRRAALCLMPPQALARGVRPPAGPRAARGCNTVTAMTMSLPSVSLRGMSENIAWPWRGCPEHSEQTSSSDAVALRVGQIDHGMQLIAVAIEQSAHSVNSVKLSNELSALACYTRSFRGLRAATVLAMEGLYLEARVYLRDVYESAGLGRLLAMNPKKADDWLLRERWIKDNEVRQYVEKFTMPGGSEGSSPYREYYRQASELHHPTMRGCLPLILDSADAICVPRLESSFDSDILDKILHEIAVECTFVCFTMINAAASPDIIWPEWRKAVHELAMSLVGDSDLDHLKRDWDADQERFDAIASHVLAGDDAEQAIDQHPNSVRNTVRRSRESIEESND